MVRRKLTAACVAVAAVVVAAAPGAFAATPNQIYQDYADNGTIDGTYSTGDLQRALKDATVQGYGHGHGGMKPQIEVKIRCQGGNGPGGSSSSSANGNGGTHVSVNCGGGGNGGHTYVTNTPPPSHGYGGGGLPFTGLDLAAMVAGAFALLAFGVGLRRFARQRA